RDLLLPPLLELLARLLPLRDEALDRHLDVLDDPLLDRRAGVHARTPSSRSTRRSAQRAQARPASLPASAAANSRAIALTTPGRMTASAATASSSATADWGQPHACW